MSLGRPQDLQAHSLPREDEVPLLSFSVDGSHVARDVAPYFWYFFPMKYAQRVAFFVACLAILGVTFPLGVALAAASSSMSSTMHIHMTPVWADIIYSLFFFGPDVYIKGFTRFDVTCKKLFDRIQTPYHSPLHADKLKIYHQEVYADTHVVRHEVVTLPVSLVSFKLIKGSYFDDSPLNALYNTLDALYFLVPHAETWQLMNAHSVTFESETMLCKAQMDWDGDERTVLATEETLQMLPLYHQQSYRIDVDFREKQYRVRDLFHQGRVENSPMLGKSPLCDQLLVSIFQDPRHPFPNGRIMTMGSKEELRAMVMVNSTFNGYMAQRMHYDTYQKRQRVYYSQVNMLGETLQEKIAALQHERKLLSDVIESRESGDVWVPVTENDRLTYLMYLYNDNTGWLFAIGCKLPYRVLCLGMMVSMWLGSAFGMSVLSDVVARGHNLSASMWLSLISLIGFFFFYLHDMKMNLHNFVNCPEKYQELCRLGRCEFLIPSIMALLGSSAYAASGSYANHKILLQLIDAGLSLSPLVQLCVVINAFGLTLFNQLSTKAVANWSRAGFTNYNFDKPTWGALLFPFFYSVELIKRYKELSPSHKDGKTTLAFFGPFIAAHINVVATFLYYHESLVVSVQFLLNMRRPDDELDESLPPAVNAALFGLAFTGISLYYAFTLTRFLKGTCEKVLDTSGLNKANLEAFAHSTLFGVQEASGMMDCSLGSLADSQGSRLEETV
jgi:hypothetical protein